MEMVCKMEMEWKRRRKEVREDTVAIPSFYIFFSIFAFFML
jgi:hypothetical protein